MKAFNAEHRSREEIHALTHRHTHSCAHTHDTRYFGSGVALIGLCQLEWMKSLIWEKALGMSRSANCIEAGQRVGFEKRISGKMPRCRCGSKTSFIPGVVAVFTIATFECNRFANAMVLH